MINLSIIGLISATILKLVEVSRKVTVRAKKPYSEKNREGGGLFFSSCWVLGFPQGRYPLRIFT